ncbi:MAG TPA: NAD-dependent epimerase/dehydratase family protein [Polyangiales bacterium]|nr:NAD-dependent epimerase/dehydratase family protein [Polyangiales bacterium]
MTVAIITGSSGLIGSEAARFFHERGLDVVGIDNHMRGYFFGDDGAVEWNTKRLKRDLPRFTHVDCDIRDKDGIDAIFARYGRAVGIVIHCAAQPSHDWAAREPFTDFSVNAQGTLVMLEATRNHCPDAVFEFTSTNKVYGDTPNSLPLVERELRWELDPSHPYAAHGIDESMSIDRSTHSLFGASKVAADVLVQEYGRYFGMKTVAFRGGCLTGPAHSGAELHGFLAYLARCAVTGNKYKVFGYKGKQVRDNIHSYDLINCFWHFFQRPRSGAVYNMGGARQNSCSVLEAIHMLKELTGRPLDFEIVDQNRVGDHIWWISDVRAFQADHPTWAFKYDLTTILREIVEANREMRRAE